MADEPLRVGAEPPQAPDAAITGAIDNPATGDASIDDHATGHAAQEDPVAEGAATGSAATGSAATGRAATEDLPPSNAGVTPVAGAGAAPGAGQAGGADSGAAQGSGSGDIGTDGLSSGPTPTSTGVPGGPATAPQAYTGAVEPQMGDDAHDPASAALAQGVGSAPQAYTEERAGERNAESAFTPTHEAAVQSQTDVSRGTTESEAVPGSEAAALGAEAAWKGDSETAPASASGLGLQGASGGANGLAGDEHRVKASDSSDDEQAEASTGGSPTPTSTAVAQGPGTAPQAYTEPGSPEVGAGVNDTADADGVGDPDGASAGSTQGTGAAPQAYTEPDLQEEERADAVQPSPPVSRETGVAAAGEARPADVPDGTGLPDTATQDVEQAKFDPTLAPGPAPAAQVTADTQPEQTESTTPLATATHQEVRPGREESARSLPRPAATRVMVIANQKGGVGKTTTTVNMAAGLAENGMRVLIIDLDPQGNASTALGIDHSAGTPGVYEVLADGKALADVVCACPDIPHLYGVPATIDLAGAEIELVSLVARESRLRKALDAYLASLDGEDRFDYVFIDCPPSLGLLTINALVAAREMLIPIQCEYYALEGVTQLLRNAEMVRAHLNPDLSVSTIVLTMYDARTRLAAGVADEVRQHFGDVVLRTAIPRSVRISEAPSYGQTVITYDPTSSGALSYLEAARELATHYPHQTEEP